jgi:hypothetical protein
MDYAITNVAYVADIVEFGQAYDTIFLRAMNEQGIKIHYNTYNSFSTITAAGSQTIIPNCKSRSLKSIFVCMRDATRVVKTGGTGQLGFDSFEFIPDTIQSYQFKAGNLYMPSFEMKLDRGGSGAYKELLKALNSMTDISYGAQLGIDDYTTYFYTKATAFCLGVNTENVQHNGSLISGLNTSDNSLSIEFKITKSAGVAQCRYDFFFLCDKILSLSADNGGLAQILE